MQYMLLIYNDEKQWAAMPEGTRGKIIAEYMDLTKSLKASGKWLAGGPLQPTETATSVRVKDGKALMTHGPFAETREQLGGYYLIEAKDLDDATAIASKVPGARYGTIEVRPLMKVEMP